MALFSSLARDRFARFKKIKRAWYSFLILSFLFILSLFSELICNDRPYILCYEDEFYFPIFQFYPEKEFGGKYLTEADYVTLRNSEAFQNSENWMLLPPVPHSPLHSYMDLEGTPPHAPSVDHWLGTDSSAGMSLPVCCTGSVSVCFFPDPCSNCHTFRYFNRWCAGIFGGMGRYGGATNDRDLVVSSFPLCGDSGGHDLFSQLYDSHSGTFPIPMDRIILLHEGRVS